MGCDEGKSSWKGRLRRQGRGRRGSRFLVCICGFPSAVLCSATRCILAVSCYRCMVLSSSIDARCCVLL